MAYKMLEMQKELQVLDTITETLEESSEVNGYQLDQNFFQDNNEIPEKKKLTKLLKHFIQQLK